jgi:hypothetical protein
VIAVNVVKENVTVQLVDGNTIDCTAEQILEVRQRVATEAQARNAEGITPVSRDRHGPKPIINGEQGLLDDDTDALRALEALDESDLRSSSSQTGGSGKQPPMRPDAALGATVTQNRRAASERSRPPVEDHPPSRSDGVTPAKWTPQSNPEPHKVLSGGDQQRAQRPGSDQARLDLAQRQEQAATPQPAESAPSEQQMQQASRRRKRNRGRGGKS